MVILNCYYMFGVYVKKKVINSVKKVLVSFIVGVMIVIVVVYLFWK